VVEDKAFTRGERPRKVSHGCTRFSTMRRESRAAPHR
jgi:hypothetical protein